MQIYSQSSVDTFVNEKLMPVGYDVEMLSGCLVDGYACYPPDNNHYLFVFLPHFLNAWSSGLEMHKYKSWETVPKKMKKIIESYTQVEEETA